MSKQHSLQKLARGMPKSESWKIIANTPREVPVFRDGNANETGHGVQRRFLQCLRIFCKSLAPRQAALRPIGFLGQANWGPQAGP